MITVDPYNERTLSGHVVEMPPNNQLIKTIHKLTTTFIDLQPITLGHITLTLENNTLLVSNITYAEYELITVWVDCCCSKYGIECIIAETPKRP